MKVKKEIELPTKVYFSDYHYDSVIEYIIESFGLNDLEVIELDELSDRGDYVFEIREKGK